MARGNGYLRQGEFRRWAKIVEDSLAILTKTMTQHSELLAVFQDRKQQGDLHKNLFIGFITAVIAALVSVIFGYLFHHYGG